MIKANVCYLHRQDSNKWEWFLADEHGRAILKQIKQFDTIEEARADQEEHGEEYASRVSFAKVQS